MDQGGPFLPETTKATQPEKIYPFKNKTKNTKYLENNCPPNQNHARAQRPLEELVLPALMLCTLKLGASERLRAPCASGNEGMTPKNTIPKGLLQLNPQVHSQNNGCFPIAPASKLRRVRPEPRSSRPLQPAQGNKSIWYVKRQCSGLDVAWES